MNIPEGLIRKVIVTAGDRDITYLRGQTIAKGALKIVDITFDKLYKIMEIYTWKQMCSRI